MQEILDRLIADAEERPLPALVRRSLVPLVAPGRALAVIGMRRSGKTCYCFQMMADLVDQSVSRDRILYINFEDERLLPFGAADFQTLLDCFYRRTPTNKHRLCYFFFDEIQRIDGWYLFIRRLLDQEQVQLTVTGSSSKLLSSEIHTSLRGRALAVEIFPFSFAEYLRARNIAIPQRAPSSHTRAAIQNAINDYLFVGGFPEVLDADPPLRRQVLQQYLDVVILRDVIERHGVTSVPALRAMVRQIIHSPTLQLSINKLYNDFKSRGLSCSKNSLHAWLDHLADAYLLFPIAIHSPSERVRQVNPKKVYLIDGGLATAASANVNENRGALLENLVFMHVRRQGNVIEYFQNAAGHETDFVVRDGGSGKILQLIQVTWSLVDAATCRREIRGLRAAMTDLNCPRGTIVTWTDDAVDIEDTRIAVQPAWRFLLQD